MGHIITSQGVQTDPQKVTAMRDWPEPKILRVLRGFLRLTGYYRMFNKNYGVISRPLTNLLKKNGFSWCQEAKITFDNMKITLCTTLVLVLSNFTQPFTLKSDACDKGIRAVFVQGKDLLPISAKL
jgi:RNase H-like domain found in reverse transcriptase